MTETTKPLSGRTALVTGASRGIGAATAKALAEAGAHVILVARKVKALEAVEDEIHAFGGTSTIAPLDLMEPDAVTRLAGAIAGRWNTLDIMVLAAAYLPELTPLAQIEPKQFNQALLTNVVATQALIAGFDPLLKYLKGKKIFAQRSTCIADIPYFKPSLPVAPEAQVEAVIADLARRKASKPRTQKTLLSTLHALFKKELSEQQLGALFAELCKRGVVKVEGEKVSYALPTEP